jgi:hypothetical protein
MEKANYLVKKDSKICSSMKDIHLQISLEERNVKRWTQESTLMYADAIKNSQDNIISLRQKLELNLFELKKTISEASCSIMDKEIDTLFPVNEPEK